MGQQERICSVCNEKETKSIAKLKATISLNVSGTIPLKTKQTFTPKVTMGKGDKVVSWKSSNKKVVSVGRNGKVKGLKAGKTATITVQLAERTEKELQGKSSEEKCCNKISEGGECIHRKESFFESKPEMQTDTEACDDGFTDHKQRESEILFLQ